MALFYDRDYGWGRARYDRGYRGRSWGGFEGAFDEPNPSMHGRYADPYNPHLRSHRQRGPYAQDFAPRADRYDTGYRRQWQTDQGDPFGDRTAHTPIRMTEGSYRTWSRRGTAAWNADYDADYSSNPVGYDPFYDQTHPSRLRSGWNRYDREFPRGRGRGYDDGWW